MDIRQTRLTDERHRRVERAVLNEALSEEGPAQCEPQTRSSMKGRCAKIEDATHLSQRLAARLLVRIAQLHADGNGLLQALHELDRVEQARAVLVRVVEDVLRVVAGGCTKR